MTEWERRIERNYGLDFRAEFGDDPEAGRRELERYDAETLRRVYRDTLPDARRKR